MNFVILMYVDCVIPYSSETFILYIHTYLHILRILKVRDLVYSPRVLKYVHFSHSTKFLKRSYFDNVILPLFCSSRPSSTRLMTILTTLRGNADLLFLPVTDISNVSTCSASLDIAG